MRGLLGRVGVRVAVAGGLLLLVLGIVAIARVAGGEPRQGVPPAPPAQVPSTVDPTAGDDAEVAVTPSAYADDADVIAAAKSFTAAWLKRNLSPEAWHAGIEPLSTQTLAESLDGVDPLAVPATRTTSEPTLVRRTELYAEVTTMVDTGTLELTLSKPDTRWLVDGVDWERA